LKQYGGFANTPRPQNRNKLIIGIELLEQVTMKLIAYGLNFLS
jgi:hypothetical protein